jgi:hypothetical protein
MLARTKHDKAGPLRCATAALANFLLLITNKKEFCCENKALCFSRCTPIHLRASIALHAGRRRACLFLIAQPTNSLKRVQPPLCASAGEKEAHKGHRRNNCS